MRFSEWDDRWRELPLQEICSFEKGSVLSKSDLSETGHPCILYGQLYTTYLSETIDEIVSKTNRLDDSIERSQVGDLIIPCSGETPEDIATARCVMVPNVLYGGDLNVLRSKHHDCTFLSYQLNGKRRMDIAKLAVGKTIVHLHGNNLKSLRVWVPSSLEEERKIAALLNLLNKRISVQNKIIEDLERLRKFINDAFFESLKTTAIFRTLYKIASEGGTPDTNLKEYYEPAEIPFIKIEDLYSKYLIQNSNYISVLGIEHSSAWLVPKGSILLSNGATIGECTITTYPLCTKQGILGIVPSDSTDSEFLYYLFKSTTFKKQLQRITTKGTMDAAYLKDIDRIQVPFCDKTRQEQHVKTLVPLERKIVLEQSLLQNLISLKRFLLANMFI